MSRTDAPVEKARAAVSRNIADTRLHGYRLAIVRFLCLSLYVLSVGLVLASIPSYFASLHLLCTDPTTTCNTSGHLTASDLQRLQALGLSIDFFAIYTILLTLLLAFGCWLVGALLLWSKSDNPLALLAAISLITFPIAFNTDTTSTLASPWSVLAHVIGLLGNLCIVLFFYIFPSGHFIPRWTRWVMIPSLAYWVFSTFFPLAPFNPFFRFPILDVVTFLTIIGGIIVVQIYRYRYVSTLTQRQQTKWVVYGLILSLGGFLFLILLGDFFPALFPDGSLAYLIATAAIYGLMLLLPLSIGLAVLKSRLWEIDTIINRTLVYGSLTATLALLYLGLVFASQFLLRGMINQDSPLAIVASTLVIAALIQPLRRRIQAIIDRRFYRRRYDAARIIAAFTATLSNEVDLSQIGENLVAVVQETMQPAHISLWLRQTASLREQNTRLLPPIDEDESHAFFQEHS